MQCKIRNTERIMGYNQAARHFETTKKPRSVRWGEDERPLYNTRSHHYRLVKGSDDYATYYDLVLYSTSMIRYYKPEANGDSRVLVRGHNKSASHQFLWWNGYGPHKVFRCIDSAGETREGRLLLSCAVANGWGAKFGIPRDWSADLTFIGTSEGFNPLIDLTRSKHIPVYKAASSAEDKAKRKHLKGLVDPWIELLGYRLDEYLNTEMTTHNRWSLRNAGASFTSALDLIDYNEQDTIKTALRDALSEGDTIFMDKEEFCTAMTKFGHAVATHLQGVKENKVEHRYNYKTSRYEPQSEVEPVTRADFRKSMESHLISMLNLREGSARVDIGQFPESIPRKYYW